MSIRETRRSFLFRRGTVKLSWRLAECANEQQVAELPRISISARNHQPRGLALSPILYELSRRGRSARTARHHGFFLDSARRLGHHGRRFLHSTWARRSTIGVRLHMRRTASSSFPRILLVCVLVNGPAGVSHAEPAEVYESARHSFRVVTVAEALDHPWSVAWLPSGEMLVTERPGRLRILRHGKLDPDPVEGLPRDLPHPGVGSGRSDVERAAHALS